jgi:hypothetical protein
MPDEREFIVQASATIDASFTVWAEDEDDARSQVENAVVTGKHAFDFSVRVDDAIKLNINGWDVLDVEAD